MTNKKCPKCGSRDFTIVDVYTVPFIYEVEDGYVTAAGDGDNRDHVRTFCECSNCDYMWHPKNFYYEIDE